MIDIVGVIQKWVLHLHLDLYSNLTHVLLALEPTFVYITSRQVQGMATRAAFTIFLLKFMIFLWPRAIFCRLKK